MLFRKALKAISLVTMGAAVWIFLGCGVALVVTADPTWLWRCIGLACVFLVALAVLLMVDID